MTSTNYVVEPDAQFPPLRPDQEDLLQYLGLTTAAILRSNGHNIDLLVGLGKLDDEYVQVLAVEEDGSGLATPVAAIRPSAAPGEFVDLLGTPEAERIKAVYTAEPTAEDHGALSV